MTGLPIGMALCSEVLAGLHVVACPCDKSTRDDHVHTEPVWFSAQVWRWRGYILLALRPLGLEAGGARDILLVVWPLGLEAVGPGICYWSSGP